MTVFNKSPNGHFCCDFRLYYRLLPSCGALFLEEVLFLGGGGKRLCLQLRLRASVQSAAAAPSRRSPVCISEVTSTNFYTAESVPRGGVTLMPTCCARCSAGAMNEIKLKYAPHTAGRSYFSQGTQLSRGRNKFLFEQGRGLSSSCGVA